MRILGMILGLLLSPVLIFAKSPHPDPTELAERLEGDYTLLGKKPDSKETYCGTVHLQAHGPNLAFTRTVNGQTSRGIAQFDTIAGDDRIPVLRLRFTMPHKQYEGTYLWATDADNYFRITGYVYLPGTKHKEVGLEALFPLQH